MSKYLFNGISSNQISLPSFTQIIIIMLNFCRRVYNIAFATVSVCLTYGTPKLSDGKE